MKITAGLILAGVLLFSASLNDPFHFDDELITQDSNVTNPARWAHFFNPLHLRQFTFFTFYLNHLAGGLNPVGFHAINIAIHVANAVLLFWLLQRFVESWIAFTAAAIFLVHPIQTEPVLYIYQRSTLLACFFSLLALIALLKGRTGWACLAFFLAFESKESALAVPLAVALLGRARPFSIQLTGGVSEPPPQSAGEPSRTRYFTDAFSVALVIAVALLAAAALAVLVYSGEHTVGMGAAKETGPVRYLLTQTRVAFTYLRLLLFPYPQSLEYEFNNAGGILSVIGVLAILALGWFTRHSVWGVSILAFFILLAPTSSIIPSADAAFEHRLYLPMLAFSVLVAYSLSRFPRRRWMATAVLIVLTVLTVRREMVWSSGVTLWEDTVRHAPGKARAWFNLGGAYLNNDFEKARAAFLRALELQPHFPEALYDLGMIEQQRKNWSGALVYYQRALSQEPGYWPALNNMGNTLFAMGEREKALGFFSETLRLNPDYWPAQYNIAIVHFESSRYMDAARRLRTVLDWRPEFREARYLLAVCLTRAGDRNSADEQWKKLGAASPTGYRHTPSMILSPSRP